MHLGLHLVGVEPLDLLAVPRRQLGQVTQLVGLPGLGGDGEPEVFVADEQLDLPVELERWQQLATEVLRSEGVRGLAELALLFVTEAEMGELNEMHMGKPGPTDVLAFPIDAAEAEIVLHGQPTSRGPDRSPADPGDMPLLLGDVVICPAVAARQAPAHAGTVEDEMALLVVHLIWTSMPGSLGCMWSRML